MKHVRHVELQNLIKYETLNKAENAIKNMRGT